MISRIPSSLRVGQPAKGFQQHLFLGMPLAIDFRRRLAVSEQMPELLAAMDRKFS